MKKHISIILSSGALLMLPLLMSCGKSDLTGVDRLAATTVDHAVETEVLTMLHQANQDEIASGQLAQKQAGDQAVKDLGKTLVDDHTKADKQVTDAATRANVKLPAEDTEPSDLRDLNGKDFDREFLSMMVDGHQDVLAKLEAALPQLGDSDTAKLVKELTPVVKSHLDTAQKLQKQLGLTPEMGNQPGMGNKPEKGKLPEKGKSPEKGKLTGEQGQKQQQQSPVKPPTPKPVPVPPQQQQQQSPVKPPVAPKPVPPAPVKPPTQQQGTGQQGTGQQQPGRVVGG